MALGKSSNSLSRGVDTTLIPWRTNSKTAQAPKRRSGNLQIGTILIVHPNVQQIFSETPTLLAPHLSESVRSLSGVPVVPDV